MIPQHGAEPGTASLPLCWGCGGFGDMVALWQWALAHRRGVSPCVPSSPSSPACAGWVGQRRVSVSRWRGHGGTCQRAVMCHRGAIGDSLGLMGGVPLGRVGWPRCSGTPLHQPHGEESIPGAGVTPGTPKLSEGALGGLLFTPSHGCHLSWRADSDPQLLTSCIFT